MGGGPGAGPGGRPGEGGPPAGPLSATDVKRFTGSSTSTCPKWQNG
jgi:hypothetical protein